MKKKIGLIVSLIYILSIFAGIFLTACSKPDKEDENEVYEQGDSRIFKFAEHIGAVSNPGIGYTATDGYNAKVGETPVHNKQGDIVLFFINIGAFSSGVNGKDTDYDLDEQFFTALRATFENCRNNGSTIAVRFRYDDSGKDNPEPKTFEQVLKHITQIKQNGVLEEYKDILMFVESGFVGKYGEQHGGKYVSVDYKAQLLAAMLDCVPAPVPVTVRTPDIFAKYVGIERKNLAEYKAEEGSDAARVGLYDDGYMGSDSDLGTYSNRETETTWLGNQTLTSYFGGEFSGNLDWAKKYDAYLPENCIPEMYKTHLSYINGNIFQLYEDYKFDKKYDVEGYDNSAYYGQTVFRFIRDHLGYRFVLNECTFPKTATQSGNLDFSFKVTNNGFANPVKKQKCEIILEKDGKFVTCEVDLDPTKWYSGTSVDNKLNLKLPAFLEAGEWKVYFKSSIGVYGFSDYGYRSIRFASKDVWQGSLGANYLGYVEVTSSDNADKLCDNTFGEAGSELKAAHLYSLGGQVAADGQVSDGEWTENDVIAESEGNKLYAKCDEENLYIMAAMPHNATKPVFNFRATINGTSYWIYRQSGGSIYFNHDKETGHDGLVIKYSDNLVEFKIPFYMLGASSGTEITQITVFVQDESVKNWPRTAIIETAQSYTVKADFTVYNSYEKLSVKNGGSYEIALQTGAEISNVIWYADGEKIAEGSAFLKLTDIDKDCVISAEITSVKGTVKQVNIAEIKLR